MTDLDRASPGSTIANSELDTHPSSPVRADPRTSLQHVLGPASRKNTPNSRKLKREDMEDDEIKTPGGMVAEAPAKPSTSRKRKEPAAGANNPTYANKVKHLKKDDGEPLWRKDIQYDFLKAVFDDDSKVFTNSYDSDKELQSFADLYIDTMARSSKTSKILRDKLLTEHEPAKNMAMVCLLVNLGRMNTTLNFFPEMRAQLRTYHAIPSLQAHQDPNSYKQLQDAPRLKSILKGASEDRPEPNSLEKIKAREFPPRTNPVNLIFVLAQYAPKVTELHFPRGNDFYDLIMGEHLSSVSRARAFLWLMWFYLESDFTEEGAEENPFGPGVDYDTDVRNQGVPRFDVLDEYEQFAENVDTQEEKDYGYAKMKERKRIIEADQIAFQAEHGPPKRGPKPKLHLPPVDDGGPSPAFRLPRFTGREDLGGMPPVMLLNKILPKYDSDMESTRSTPPPRALGGMRVQAVLNTGPRGRSAMKQVPEGSSPVGPIGEHIVRRSRPLTAHQLAVERNRNQRVDYILSRGLRKKHHQAKKQRRQDGAFWRGYKRTKEIANAFDDSEDEENILRESSTFRERGFGGLIQLQNEDDDFGEEVAAYAAAFRRMGRRLDRWDTQKDLNLGVMGTNRVAQNKPEANGHEPGKDADETEDEKSPRREQKRGTNGTVRRGDADMDDTEKEIVGMGTDEEGDPDEELDDVEKALLGIQGDETEDDNSDGMDID